MWFDGFSFNLYALPHMVISFTILGIGIYRLIRAVPGGIPFALLCFSLFLWNFGVALNLFSSTDPFLVPLRQFYYLGICFMPAAFFFYVISFLHYSTRQTRLLLWFLIIISSFFLMNAFINRQFIAGGHRYWFGYYAVFGWMGWMFLFYMHASLLSTLILWVKFYRQTTDPMHRHRIRIITGGLMLMLPVAVDFLPAIGFPIYPFGVFFSLLFIIFQSYAAFTFRITQLQKASSILQQYVITLFLAILPWGAFSFAFYWFFKRHFLDATIIFSILSFMLLVPYVTYVLPWMTRRLFHKDYHFRTLLWNFLHETYRLKDIGKLSLYLKRTIGDALQVSDIHLLYRDADHEGNLVFHQAPNKISCPPEISSMIPWFEQNPSMLFRYDVDFFPEFSSVRPAAQAAFNSLEAQLFIPLVQAGQVLGIVAISRKARQPYFNHFEIDFLRELKSIATISINNSQLYENIRRLSRTLWSVNQNLNQTVREKTRELEIALDKMKRLNDEQVDFFTMASHNLRTPLTSIKASTRLLWGESDISGTEDNELKVVLQNNIRRLEMLIRYIIEIVKMDEGKQEFIDGSSMIFSSMKNDLTSRLREDLRRFTP